MGHREWWGIGASDFQRKISLCGAGVTSGYVVGTDEYFGCTGLFGKDAMGRNCEGAMSKTFGRFKSGISYADDYDGDDEHAFGCDMTRVGVGVVSSDRSKNSSMIKVKC